MRTAFDAIIIGAGPAGATAAILLAQAGWSVAVIERQCFPRRKVCGECIAATNLQLLEALGVGSAFHALAGPPLRQLAVMSGPHLLKADLPPLSGGSQRWGRAMSREHLDLLLLQQAARRGAALFQPWTVESFSGRPAAWQCRVRPADSTITMTLEAPVLIAACGSWGNSLLGKQRSSASDLLAFKACYQDSRLEPGLLPVLAFSGGYGGMVVGGHGVTTVACCIRRDRLARLRKRTGVPHAGDAVEAWLMESCEGVHHALDGAQRLYRWLSAGPIRPGVRIGDRHCGLFLIGNAAGEAHPIIGEGISMAMQSAWMLCELLTARKSTISSLQAQQTALQEYAALWRAQFGGRMRFAALFAHLAMHPRLASALLPLLRRRPGLLTQAARLSGKVHLPAAGGLAQNQL